MIYDIEDRQKEVLKILKAIKKASDRDDLEGLCVIMMKKTPRRSASCHLIPGVLSAFEWTGLCEVLKLEMIDLIENSDEC